MRYYVGIATAVFTTLVANAQEITPRCTASSAAEQFYPHSLDERLKEALGEDATYRQSCGEQLNATETIAAYSNGISSIVRLLGGEPLRVLAETAELPAANALVQLTDLTGDGQRDVLITAHNNTTLSTWIFERDATGLRTIGPMIARPAGALPALSVPYLQDVTGDGVLDVIESRIGAPDTVGSTIHVLRDGKLSTFHAPFWATYLRDTAQPVVDEQAFRAEPGLYVLRVIVNNVTAGTIVVNDEVVMTPGDLKRKSGKVEIPVTLHATNQITVDLRGEPGSGITVTFLKQ